ncbi:hypothetical protein [Bradyrhizobium sp.]|uniref:hypothetical protein n=1 Tax=Bradyrhizobium sp. TaxID=376 RepID=UPI003C23E8E9
MLKEIPAMKRTISIPLALALTLSPTFAFADSKTYNFNGWFADESSVAAGENALGLQAAIKVCPSYGNYSQSFQPFTYTWTNFVLWTDYSAANVNFSVTCTWEQVNHTFSGASFEDYGSVQNGENAIQGDYWRNPCGGGKHLLTNMQFNQFSYTHTDFGFWQDYSASGISGSFTCDE